MKHIVNWGIIGLGNIAFRFARSFYNVNNAKLIAVASNSNEKLLNFKENFKIKKENLHNNYEEILKNELIDVVYIALPNNFHFEWALKALDNKKNILIEKPALVSSKQVEIIFNHKYFDSVFFGEGYMYKYNPQIINVIHLIQEFKLGKPLKMKSNFGMNLVYKKNFFGFKKKYLDKNNRIFNKKLDGGVILDIGCYTTSMSLLIASLINNIDVANFKIDDIKTKYLETNIDVHSSAKINFDNKFTSDIVASFIKKIGNQTQIFCEDGEILIENSWISEKSRVELKGRINKSYNFNLSKKNVYSLQIEEISKDILDNRTEASFPGTSKKDIFLNTKLVDKWVNG
ncbi:Gfo/Idh/MocA family oxidoreductase [Candidatus Pelagibacter sp.]|nr:Gfo/Idh/MocA family oxidoreductase [Candidatus Pelagibacter sp.]